MTTNIKTKGNITRTIGKMLREEFATDNIFFCCHLSKATVKVETVDKDVLAEFHLVYGPASFGISFNIMTPEALVEIGYRHFGNLAAFKFLRDRVDEEAYLLNDMLTVTQELEFIATIYFNAIKQFLKAPHIGWLCEAAGSSGYGVNKDVLIRVAENSNFVPSLLAEAQCEYSELESCGDKLVYDGLLEFYTRHGLIEQQLEVPVKVEPDSLDEQSTKDELLDIICAAPTATLRAVVNAASQSCKSRAMSGLEVRDYAMANLSQWEPDALAKIANRLGFHAFARSISKLE